MGLFSKVVVLSACVVLAVAQDYEYAINQDKVSFRQNPTIQRPASQSNSFQRAQPSRTAPFAKFEAIPQVKITQFAAQPQQNAAPQNQYVPQPQEFSTQAPFAAAPARIQVKPAGFRPAAASTYVPNSAPAFSGNRNTFNQAPAQSPQTYNEEPNFAPAPAPTQQPQRFQEQEQRFQAQEQRFQPQEQTSFEQTPVRRVKVRPSAGASTTFSSEGSTKAQSADDLAIIQEQNAGAKYAFSSQLQNSIQDNSLQRQEVRDGLALKGMYSYSDGFYKRTVQYEADENGYRVINENAEPIGNGEGPQINLDGKAQIATNIDGTSHGYSITADDIVDLRKQRQPQPFRILA